MDNVASMVLAAAEQAKAKVESQEETVGTVLHFNVGVKGNREFSISADDMSQISMLEMIEGLAVIQLSLMSSLIPQHADQNSDPVVESLKAFEATKRQILIQSFINGGLTRASEIFDGLKPIHEFESLEEVTE